MDAHCEMILDEYRENQETFAIIRDVVLKKLKTLTDQNNMLLAALEARIKTEKSLSGKLELKGSKYHSLSDITDIVGARVVTFYSDEVDKIAALVEHNFDIDWDNSIDKRKIYDTDRFGYLSLHYICKIPKSTYYDEAHPGVNEFRFEIQMRTVLQHAWATNFHDTGYKSDVEVPPEYLRRLSRLAGLMELADSEFCAIRNEIDDYRRGVRELVKNKKFNEIALNGDTFRSYLDTKPFDKITHKIASINRAEIQEVNAMPYLAVLKKLNFKTLGDVEKMRLDYQDLAYEMAMNQIGATDLDIIASTITLQNLVYIYILKHEGGVAGIKMVFDTLYGERELNSKSAKRIVDQATRLRIIANE